MVLILRKVFFLSRFARRKLLRVEAQKPWAGLIMPGFLLLYFWTVSRKAEQKLPVKERIIKAATRLFYTQGLKDTGINQIINESNVAKASFYQYFPSKNDLVLTCLDEYYHTLSAVLKRVSGSSDTIEEFFTKWSRLIKKNATTRDSFMGCPIANIGFQVDPGNMEIKEKFNEIIDGWFRILEPLFQKAAAEGRIPLGKDLKELFVDVFALNEGALLIWRLTGKQEYLNSVQSSIIKLLKE